MAADASWPLQRAILDALTRDGEIAKLCGGKVAIFAGAQNDETVPKIRYAESTTRAWHSATFDGQEHDIVLHIESGGEGPPVRRLAAAVVERLHDADLPIPGHALIELEFESSETRSEEAPGRQSCRMFFKALTVSD